MRAVEAGQQLFMQVLREHAPWRQAGARKQHDPYIQCETLICFAHLVRFRGRCWIGTVGNGRLVMRPFLCIPEHTTPSSCTKRPACVHNTVCCVQRPGRFGPRQATAFLAPAQFLAPAFLAAAQPRQQDDGRPASSTSYQG